MSEKTLQINRLHDGRVRFGNYADLAIQSTIDHIDKKTSAGQANFQTTVDINNLNHRHKDALDNTNQYFARIGLPIAPIRVIGRDTLHRAYKVAGESMNSTIGDAEGRNVHDRALVIENAEMIDFLGEDITLGIMLHEAAHSTGNGERRSLRTVTEGERRRTHLARAVIELGSWGRIDARKNAKNTITGDFFEEAFADLTRVRALRALDKVHDLDGATSVFGEHKSAQMKMVPNSDDTVYDGEVIHIPAEFAMGSRSVDGKNWRVSASPNFAAYALELLDRRVPGLYDDFIGARQDPKQQAAVIRKIESVRPGLYKDLRDLEYSEADFQMGLKLVVDALENK